MKISRSWLAGVLALTASAVQSVGAIAEKRVALVIGNAAYTDIAPLKKPPADAGKIADVLKGMGFQVTLSVDAKKDELDRLANAFRQNLEGADVGFFYYSGHGFQTARATQQHPVNNIVAVDFSVESVETELRTLSLDLVIDALRAKARLGYVFMDACRSDPRLAEATQRYAAGQRSVSISRGFSPVSASVPLPPHTKVTDPKRPLGLLIAYATDPGNVALEGEKGQFSPFTSALVKHMSTPGLSISEVMGRVSSDVAIETSGQQTPWSVASLTAGTYQFVPRATGGDAAAARPAPSGGGRSTPSPAAARSSSGGGSNAKLPPNIGVGAGSGF